MIYLGWIVRLMAAKTKSNKQKEEEAPDTEVITMEEQLEPEATIEDLPGVGPATAEKLREAGFDELLALAVMSPGDLAEQAELGEAVAGKIIQAAKKMAIPMLLNLNHKL